MEIYIVFHGVKKHPEDKRRNLFSNLIKRLEVFGFYRMYIQKMFLIGRFRTFASDDNGNKMNILVHLPSNRIETKLLNNFVDAMN